MFHKHWKICMTVCLLSVTTLQAAELSVGNLVMNPGSTTTAIVSGLIISEDTFGVTILLQINSRAGNTGTVTFTPAPAVDIVQVGDPWPGVGTFSVFDTDITGFVTLNGSVDDSGAGAATLTYSGPLSGFPVVASANADGIWDIVLSTSFGDSSWQGQVAPLPTTLIAGTITVMTGECLIDTDCDDTVACTNDTCVGGNCIFTVDNFNCPDDGVFCNGSEVCDANSDCISTGNLCQINEFCNETTQLCDECQVAADCDDGVGCTDDSCVSGSCVNTANDANCPDDGVFCNGTEFCDSGSDCVSTGSPCLVSEICDELGMICTSCTLNSECDDTNICTDDICNAGICEYTNNINICDDGFFCTLTDTCSNGACVGFGDPCTGQVCDENLNACVGTVASLTVNSMSVNHGTRGDLLVSGKILGLDTFGVTILVELIGRVGNTGTLTFTPAPPFDITQAGDPWPGVGVFTLFDTDPLGTNSLNLNGSIDDNGEAQPTPASYDGLLSSFPVIASTDAGGAWDVLLSTSSGDSGWEGITTTLNAGIITVTPPVGLEVKNFAMPPDSVQNLVVNGTVDNLSTSGVSILLEVKPRAGTTGTLTFTPAPPVDITELNDPWPGVGTFTPFDTDVIGFITRNGVVSDNGIFTPEILLYSGPLASFPVIASIDADGVWDVTLSTSSGTSSWQNLSAVLIEGTITVTPGACLTNTSCDDGNVCTDDICDAGFCLNIDNTSTCDDADQCTTNDVCTLGVCVGVPVVEGGLCDDGDLCTVNDVCNGGACAGSPKDCTGLDNACNVGTCNATTGNCEAVNINEGLNCDDGNVCTSNDLCTTGICSGVAIDCSSLDGECQVGTCNTTTGICEGILFADNTLCDDLDVCTENDVCTQGVCAGADKDCSTLDDGCILGTCNATTGVCEAIAVNEGDPCNDANLCTENDICLGGSCSGTQKDCSSLDSTCSIGICNVSSGLCVRSSINDGLACDDGFTCTQSDTCSGGFCTGTLVGTPGVDITLSPVSPTYQVGETVQIEIIASSSTCADQAAASVETILAWNPTFLRLTGKVDAPGSIWNLSEFPDDSNLDGLNAPFGNVPENDGDAFYLAFAGFILNEAAFVPEAGLVVTTLEFLALDGIVSTQIAMPLSSGFFTKTRVLGAGSSAGVDISGSIGSTSIQIIECQNGSDCNDGILCTTDTCTNGICANTNNTISCDDGFFCTDTDNCSAGICVGNGDPCPPQLMCSESLDACVECFNNNDCVDGDVCTTDTCNALGACIHTDNTAVCDDGLFCTASDQCNAGQCIGSGNRCPGQLCDEPGDRCVDCLVDADCDTGNVCTTDSCDVAAGVCIHAINSLPCDDLQFCTTTDTCVDAVCVGTGDPCPGQLCNDFLNRCVECLTNVDCDDANECTSDLCNVDTCINANNTNSCEDGLFCTTGDFCDTGVCISGVENCDGQLCDEPQDRCVDCFVHADCDDGIDCTINICDSALGFCRFPADDDFCNDQVFCNGVEFCSQTNDCMPTTNPCDDPTLCDELNDSCGCQDPFIISEGCRYIAITPASGQRPVAFLVTGNPADSSVACVSAYVQADGTLGPNPVFQTPAQWDTVHLSNQEIIPSRTYRVVADCRDVPTDPENLSIAVTTTTWRWSDVNNDSRANIDDVLIVVTAWLGGFNGVSLYNVDLTGCQVNRSVDIDDVLQSVNAFLGAGFRCSVPCP